MVQRPDPVRGLAHVDLAHHGAGGGVDHRELACPARGQQDHLAVGRDVHVVGTSRPREMVDNFHLLVVDLADGVGHAVAHQHVAPVAKGPKRMRALAGLDGLDQAAFLAAHVIHLDAVAARQADQHGLVVRGAEDVGRHRTGLDAPLQCLGGQVDRHQFVAVLHGGPDRRALAVDPEVARGLAGGNALGQGHVAPVPAVDVHMVEAVGCGDKPFHVGREPQVVGIQDAAHLALHLGRAWIDERQRIAERIGHDHRLFIRCHVEVVRLLAGGNALDLFPGHGVDHADVAVQRIQHKNRVGCGSPGQQGTGQAEQGRKERKTKKRLHKRLLSEQVPSVAGHPAGSGGFPYHVRPWN